MDIGSFLTEPLGYAFIQRGLLALILVGGINAVVGCFVVARGMAFFGDAMAHAILPGIALSYTASGGSVHSNLFVGGLGAGVLAAVVIAWLTAPSLMGTSAAAPWSTDCNCAYPAAPCGAIALTMPSRMNSPVVRSPPVPPPLLPLLLLLLLHDDRSIKDAKQTAEANEVRLLLFIFFLCFCCGSMAL